MERLWFASGSFFALAGVALGAFGAHGLRGALSDAALATFETGVRYQMYHALALLAVGLLVSREGNGAANLAGGLFVAGILLFSGSLYLLALTDIKFLGAIAPLGGGCFLFGWIALLLSALRG